MKKLLMMLLLLVVGAGNSLFAQTAVTVGNQVTDVSNIVSGNAYLLQHQGNGTNTPWLEDKGTFYNCPNSAGNCNLAAVWYLIDNGDGTWKIENAYTGKYWPKPTGNANLVGTDAASAGNWALNFSSGVAAPTCNGYRLNRNTPNLVGWNSGSGSVTQVKIYEVTASALSTAATYSAFADKDISVSATEAASISEGQWYVMKNRGRNGYAFENSGSMKNQGAAPAGSATDNAKFLVRFMNAGSGKYYLQNGLGNYWGAIPQNTAVPATALGTEKYTIGKINSTDGHFYLTSETNGIVLDCQENGYPVVGWGTDIPTSTGGNNDWAFFPVELVDAWVPAIDEVYTINNTNSNRGAMMYNGSSSYVWSSGKSGTFSATDPNCQWVLVPTGITKQYYLYNVGAGKFAIPSATSSTASWIFSSDAVAVTFITQNDGTKKIKTVTTDTYAAVSNGFNGPIINYNDVGGNFTITKVDGDESSAATAAFNKLVDNTTAASAVPSSGSDSWYIIRIKTHGTYADKYVYPSESEIDYNGTYYPLTFDHGANIRPAIDDACYYTRITNEGGTVYWQMPNGKFLYGSGNKFPISTATKSSFSMDYTNASGFRMWGSSRYAVPYLLSSKYFIGETSSSGNAYYDIYPIDLTTAGLTPWQVTITNGSDAMQLTCTRSDVKGLTEVYNNGYFFLPTGVTPSDSDFSLTGMISCTVDETNHTITAVYDPELSITSDDIVVKQGNQVTGKGNTMQALLRIKATPFSDFQPTQFTISLSGASNVDNVKVYSTTSDQIRFAGVTPTLLGTADSPSDGTVYITVTSESVAAGTTLYYWITADVKSTASEWETIDASLSSISYTNAYKAANSLYYTDLDLSSIGNPGGEMRIYKSQNTLWTSSKSNSKYYRIPALLKTGTNTLLAFTDDRYASTSDLGGNHKIDVIVKKSIDGGTTWGNAVTVAAGDGSTAAGYGYGDAAVAQAANGDIVCLMAAGNTSYGNGMLHIGYTKSTDGGATWSAVTDLYESANLTNNHTFQSTFVSSGHGITQTIANEGRIAFPALGKVSGTTNEYVIYSDDNGANWTFTDNYGYTGADESKLLELNDGKLLMSIRTGGFNSSNVARGYNRTTDTNVENWGTQGTWSDLTANGCNSDLIYYIRSTSGGRDVMLHSVVKSYSNHRKDLRLYMSFDEGATWKEAFQLQPGWAAYSSMQVLDNGDLAILFEDGSIGNEDTNDCYDINYVTISKELMDEKIDELYDELYNPLVKNSVQGSTTGANSYGSFSTNNNWSNTWTSNASSGLAGLTISANGNVLNHSNVYDQRCFAMRPSSAGATDVITITAPTGYYIDSYTITGRNYGSAQTYQLYVDENAKTTTSTSGATFSVNNVNAPSTSFNFYGSSTSNYLCITNFTIQLRSKYPVTLNTVGAASYATLYLPFDVTTDTNTKAYYIGSTTNGSAQLTELTDGEIAARTAVLLVNETANSATFNVTSGLTQQISESSNLLKGTLVPMSLDLSDATSYYSMGKKDNAIGFYKFDNNGTTTITLGANKAYLEVPASNGVKGFTFNFDDADGITISTPLFEREGAGVSLYNLAGQRLSKPQKGVNIINGKKVVIK